MQPMDTAPKDGTRILIKTTVFAWNRLRHENLCEGEKWVEAWWSTDTGGQLGWLIWCGSPRTLTTERLTPLGWAPCPM